MDSNDMIKLKQKSQQDLNAGSKSGFNTERVRSNVPLDNFKAVRECSPQKMETQNSWVKIDLGS